MPSAYSVDFRERAVQQPRRMGWSQHETAEYFGIGVATVYRWLACDRDTGTVEPLPHGVGPERVVKRREEAALQELVDEQPDRTLRELGQLLTRRFHERLYGLDSPHGTLDLQHQRHPGRLRRPPGGNRRRRDTRLLPPPHGRGRGDAVGPRHLRDDGELMAGGSPPGPGGAAGHRRGGGAHGGHAERSTGC